MLESKHFKFVFVIFVFYSNLRHVITKEENTQINRSKRTLIWPPGNSRLQIITGVGVPVDLKLETVIIGAIIKGNYYLPDNVTYLRPFSSVYYQRKRRSLSRWDIYDLLAQLWQLRGFGGKSCILRTICELSHTPVDKNNGLFDEMIHTVFSPSTTKESVRRHSDNEYYAAQRFGKQSGEACRYKFADCGLNMLDIFTV